MSQAGYGNSLNRFLSDNNKIIKELKDYVSDASDSQIRAWRDSIKILKNTVAELKQDCPEILSNGSIILEYTIPLESRRVDAILLLNGVVISIEFKGKSHPLQADIDQAAAYARDLQAYHKECASSIVKCLLVLSQGFDGSETKSGVEIIGSEALTKYCINCIDNEIKLLEQRGYSTKEMQAKLHRSFSFPFFLLSMLLLSSFFTLGTRFSENNWTYVFLTIISSILII